MFPLAKFHGTISTFTIGTVYWILLSSQPPQKINGYSADLSDTVIYPNREILLSRDKIDLVDVFKESARVNP